MGGSLLKAQLPTAAPLPVELKAQPTGKIEAANTASPVPLPTDTLPMPTLGPSLTPLPVDVDIEGILASMSLEQKVGQMIMSVLPGETVDQTAIDLIRGRQIGSIILTDVNVNGAEQAAQLNRELQDLAAGSKPHIPLLIVIGNEGGREFRFTSGATHFPGQMALAAANDPDLVRRVANASARELRSMGFNAVTSPVLDVNDDPYNPVIGWRSFGDSPQKVAELGAAYLSGAREGGIIAIAKHFPGHGNTEIDSHAKIPFINRTYADLAGHELVPFQRAIYDQVPAIMVGHIANQEIDSRGLPASLSRNLNSGILRKKMDFKGVTITDALTMSPIRSRYAVEDVALMAAAAGNDILMFTNPGDALTAQETLMSAVKDERIPEESINRAVRRILMMKAQYGLFKPQAEQAVQVSLADDNALARQAARQAIYAQNVPSWPAIQTDRVMLISPDLLSKGSQEGDGLSLLGERLTARGIQVDEWIYPLKEPDKAAAMREDILRELYNYPLVILLTSDARLNSALRQDNSQDFMVKAVYDSGVPVIFVAISSPYDLSLALPGQPALATFGETDLQIEALVDALLADGPPSGVLPVRIH